MDLWQINTGLLTTHFDISSVFEVAITPDDRSLIVVTEDQRALAVPLPVEARPVDEVAATLRRAEGFELRRGQLSLPAPPPRASAPPRRAAPLATQRNHD